MSSSLAVGFRDPEDEGGVLSVGVFDGITGELHFWRPVEPLFRSKKKNGFSVAVGDPAARSAIWRYVGQRLDNDVYVKSRRGDGNFKVSLHQSGRWRINQDMDGPVPPRIRTVEGREVGRTALTYLWPRPATIASHALTISVPGSSLLLRTPQGERADADIWLDAPRVKDVVELATYLVQPARVAHVFAHRNEEVHLDGPPSDTRFVDARTLPNGEVLLLMALYRPMRPEERTDVVQLVRQTVSYGLIDPHEQEYDALRASFFGVDDDEGGFFMWDVAVS